MRLLSTSSTVTRSRNMARGTLFDHFVARRRPTLAARSSSPSPSCSAARPCRTAWSGRARRRSTRTGRGTSRRRSDLEGPAAVPIRIPPTPTRLRPLCPMQHRMVVASPEAIAAAACRMWMRNDVPPTEVLSTHFGTMPRLWASAAGFMVADMPSIWSFSMPASRMALTAASMWSSVSDMSGMTPSCVVSEAPTMAVLYLSDIFVRLLCFPSMA